MSKLTTRPSSLPLTLIAATSVAVGVLVHVMAVRQAPSGSLPQLTAMTEAQKLQQLRLSPGSKTSPVLAHLAETLGGNPVSNMTWLLVLYFRDYILTRPFGKALLVYLLAIAAPLTFAMASEAVSPRRGKALGPLTLILVTGIGQVITIGAATNIFWIPLLAYSRWSQATQTPADRLAPGPSAGNTALALICATASGLTAVATSVVPTTDPNWAWANVAFQYFPLAFIPLLFAAPSRSAPLPKESAGTKSIWQLSPPVMQIIFQGLAIFVAWPQLAAAYKQGGGHIPGALALLWKNRTDGEHLLIWDGFGLAVASWAAILIERESDRIAEAGGEKKVHPSYSTIMDVVLSLPTAIVIGQGFITARFFARRDERLIAARKAIPSKTK